MSASQSNAQNPDNQSFADMFLQSETSMETKSGRLITAQVSSVDSNFITFDARLKSEARVPVSEFRRNAGDVCPAPGDFVRLLIETIDDGHGASKLSYEKARMLIAWESIEKAHADGVPVSGVVTSEKRGGFSVSVNGVTAFLPASLAEPRFAEKPGHIGSTSEFLVIKIERSKNNLVVSRRGAIALQSPADMEDLAARFAVGTRVPGTVKNIASYGAFVDLGPIDGLLHIGDISWKRIRHPSDALAVGQSVETVVIGFDKEKNRVSLGLKQLSTDPLLLVSKDLLGRRLSGTVTRIVDFGLFVEIFDGIEGLAHVSELDWTNKNPNPTSVASVGDKIDVTVLEVDTDRRRVALGVKQCSPNPWEAFASEHPANSTVSGTVSAVTDFGVFVTLPGNIEGLLHFPKNQPAHNLKKGDPIAATVVSASAADQRVSLAPAASSRANNPSNPAQPPSDAERGSTNLGALLLGKFQEKDAK